MLTWHSLGERDLPDSSDWLAAGEVDRVATMRFTKRRGEWLLARWTAKQTLAAELGLPGDPASLAAIEIRTIIGGEAQGAPEVFVDGHRSSCGEPDSCLVQTEFGGHGLPAQRREDDVGTD